MKQLKKFVIFTLCLGLITLQLSGCNASEVQNTDTSSSSSANESIREVTFCESWDFDGGFFSLQAPNVTNGTYGTYYFLCNFYETLVNYEDGKIVPGLAEKWNVSDDGLTYTFTLKQGIKFSDGTDFNAEAVKINLDNIPNILAEFNGGWGLTSTLLDKVTVVDEYTVDIKLTTPYYGALQDFTTIMPMGMMSPNGYNADGTLAEITKTKTLGTGPYMYDGQKDNETYTFVRNPYYDRGKSDVDVFHVKVIPDNDAKVLALRSGEVDMILGSGNLSYNSFEELTNSKEFTSVSSKTTIQSRTMGFNVTHEPFNDPAVRLAANYALDTNAISNNIFYGVETPADSILDKSLPYCDVDTGTYEYDVKKAKQILNEAGWVDSNGDGIREKDGIKLSGNILYASDRATLGDLASTISAQLKEVGFEITPVGKEQMVYFQEISNGNFDLAIAITNAIPSDPYLLVSRLLTDNVIDHYLAQGLADMDNADEIIKSLNAMTDDVEIQNTYNTLLQELHDEATLIPLTRVKGMAVYNNKTISDYEFYNQPDYLDVSAITLSSQNES